MKEPLTEKKGILQKLHMPHDKKKATTVFLLATFLFATVMGTSVAILAEWNPSSSPIQGISPVYADVTGSGAGGTIASFVNGGTAIKQCFKESTYDLGQTGTWYLTINPGCGGTTTAYGHINGAQTGSISGSGSQQTNTYSYTFQSTGATSFYVSGSNTQYGSVTGPTKDLTVNSDPTISVSIPQTSIDIGQTVTIGSSQGGGTSGYSYQWFKNGGAVSGQTSSSYAYAAASTGSKSFYVELTDATGDVVSSNTVSATVYTDPTLSISSGKNPSDVGQLVSYTTGTSGGAGGNSYSFSVYDGTSTSDSQLDSGSGAQFSYQYQSAGSFLVTYSLTDAAGYTVSTSLTQTVNTDPSASITSSQNPTDSGQTITFSSSESGGTSGYSYQWYSNSNPVSGQTGTTYAPTLSSGTYVVYLSVTDAAGYTANSNSITETVNGLPTITATSNTSTADVNYPIEFCSSPSAGITPYSYTWVINGNQVSTSQDFSHSFSTAGQYTVTVTLTDGDGNTHSASVVVAINPNPTVTASSSLNPMDSGQSVTFTTSESGGTGTLNYNWVITGPSDSSSSGSTFSTTLSAVGTYTVTVTVTDGDGHTATSTISEVVYSDPTATVSSSENPTDVGNPVTFTAQTSGGSGGFNYTWVVGGGTVSYNSSYSTSFSSTGTVVISLTVKDSVGESYQTTFDESVNSDPSATIASSQNPTDVGNPVTFTATATGGTGSYSYQWYSNSNQVSGANLSTYTTSFSSASTYSIYAVIKDSLGNSYTTSTLSETVNSDPTVQVTSSQNATDVGNTVQFSARIAGGTSPYTYSWYVNGVFENVTSSAYSRTFSSPGNYSITVYVKDQNGNKANYTFVEDVNPDPSITIISKQNPTDQGKTVELIGNTSGGTGPYTYSWTINGNDLTGQYLNYTFTTSGTVPVYLTVKDANRNAASTTLNEVVNPLPAPSISAEYATVDAYVNDTFIGTISGGTSPYTYSWYINGAPVSSNQSFTTNFTAPGTYNVMLNISDAIGEIASTTKQITVEPRANASISGPIQIDVSTAGYYTAALNTSVGYYSLQWIVGGILQSKTTGTISLTFQSTGSIKVQLIATGHSGASNATAYINVQVNQLPQVVINSSGPSQIDLGYAMQFNSTVKYGSGPFSYVWYISGQEVSQQPTASYQFNNIGVIQVRLVVFDLSGNQVYAYLNITVSQDPGIAATAGAQYIDTGIADYLNASMTNGIAPFNYTWTVQNATLYGPDITYTFSSAGTYLVTVTGKDSFGFTSTTSIYIYVQSPVQASISTSATSVDVGQSVNFVGSGANGVQPYNYSWYSGGVLISYGLSASYSFSSSGTHEVELIIKDRFGQESAAYSNITVSPVLSVSFSSHNIDLGEAETLQGNLSGGSGPYHYLWAVNGLGYSSSSAYSFQFFTTGTYSVLLTVTDAAGQKANFTSTIIINNIPGAAIKANYTTLDPEIQDTLSGVTQNGTGPYAYQWELNGTQISTSPDLNYTFAGAGEYSFKLTVTDATGYSVYATLTITVAQNPNISIDKPATKKDANVPITFDSTLSGGVGPYTYQWLIGATTYNVTNPTVDFASPGNYTLQLTVSDAFGRDAIETSSIIIYSDPSVSLVSSGNPTVSLPHTLSANVSGGVGPYNVHWFFASGSQESGSNISHVFGNSGLNSFQTQVRDATGYTVTANFTVQVNLYVRIAENTSSGFGPLAVQFSSTVIGGSGYAYSWNFGDGQDSLLQNPTTTFAVGNYTVKFTATSSNGASGSQNATIVSKPEPATFSFTPQTNITTLVPVTFYTDPSWAAGSNYSVSWTFPSGFVASGKQVNYTFPDYHAENTVIAKITYDNGQAYSYDLSVAMVPTPLKLVWNVQQIIEVGRLVNASATASSIDAATYQYEWSIAGQVYYGQDQILNFNSPGNYTVSVTAISSLGNTKTLSRTVTAEVPGSSSSIVLNINETSVGPVTTYSVQVVSPYSILMTQAYLGESEFNLTPISHSGGGQWYNLTLNQGEYDVGTYVISFIAYASNGQSHASNTSFVVSPEYGIQQATIYSYFGGFTNFLIFVFVVVAGVGLLVMLAVWHKRRNTLNVNLGGDVELQGIKTPKYRRMKKMEEKNDIKRDFGLDRNDSFNGGGGFP